MPFVRGTWVHRFGMRGIAMSALAAASLAVAGCSTIMHPLGGGKGPRVVSNPESAAQIGVNAYLWRATLDTLSFMPLASADPFGGTIITDWYTPAGATNERFRAQAYVLGRQLRSDGVKVQLFRQTLERGQWVDSPVSASTN